MNYIKKITEIGFKRVGVVILYSKSYYGLNIDTIENFIKDHIKSSNKKFDIKNDRINLSEMRISDTYSNLKRLQTFKYKLSNTSCIYLTISGQSYTCFISDESSKGDSVIFVENSKFTESFWKEILNKLDLRYKREIIMNQLF